MTRRFILSLMVLLLLAPSLLARAAADPETYLSELRAELQKRWQIGRAHV